MEALLAIEILEQKVNPSILKDAFSSRADPSIFTSIALVLLDHSNETKWVFLAMKSTSPFMPQSTVYYRSDSSSEAKSSCCHQGNNNQRNNNDKISFNDTEKNSILLTSVKEWLLGFLWPFFKCFHNQLRSIHSVTRIKEHWCLKNVIQQIDSKNEWLLLSASFTAKFGLVFVWTLGHTFS